VSRLFCMLADLTPLPQLVIAVMAAVAIALVATSDQDKAGEADEAHTARIHACIASWAEQMHVEIDGRSCRYGSVSECDVHMTDGTREHLQCDQTGCATRGKR
jgi:hypothetical protein